VLKTSLIKVLLKSGDKQTFNSSAANVLTEAGSKVTFTANSLTATGNIDLAISPIDVSTNQINGAPGDFSARTTAGQAVTLESFSMADFTLSQNGKKVNLKPGKTAKIELLLPVNTTLKIGNSKPMWYFNTANGLWQQEGVGVVGLSTTTVGRKAVFATVRHFTWWNSDQPLNSTAISGKVVDKNGLPVAGANVEGFGIDYDGHSYAVSTDTNGNYCIQVKTSSTTSLMASNFIGSVNASSSPLSVTSGAKATRCGTGPTKIVTNIVLPTALSCVSGDVKDINNLPVADASVYSTTGGFAATDANGNFQLIAPENASVKVNVRGYPVVNVTTAAAGAPCVVAAIRPSVGPTACLTGKAICTFNNSGADRLFIGAFDAATPLFTNPPSSASAVQLFPSPLSMTQTATDSTGTYCLEGLPANTDVYMAYSSDPVNRSFMFDSYVPVNSGTGGGSCATSCNAGPTIVDPYNCDY
jgi:hypothetical protein